MTGKSAEPRGPHFVDPSVYPQIAWDGLKTLLTVHGVYSLVKDIPKLYSRLPSIEYAVGFDGVDDYLSVPNLDIENRGLDFETNIWISQKKQKSPILNIQDNDGENVFTLATINEENFRTKVFYKEGGNIETRSIDKLKLEKWQNLRVRSDSKGISIEIDGDQVIWINEVNLENSPFKLVFGRDNGLRHFDGMIKDLKIRYHDDDIFNLQSGENIIIEDETNSAVTAGIHKMKKERFETEFKPP